MDRGDALASTARVCHLGRQVADVSRTIQSFAPNNAPTPAVRPMARAPQKVTRTTDFNTGEPPARAAREPSSARKASELPETTQTSADSGTKKTSSSGRAAPTVKEHAEAKAA